MLFIGLFSYLIDNFILHDYYIRFCSHCQDINYVFVDILKLMNGSD